MNNIIEVICSEIPLMKALTIKYVDTASSIARVSLTPEENAEEVANTVIEGVIVAHLLNAAGLFRQFQPDYPCVACGCDLIPQINSQRIITLAQPLRSNDYPRRYQKHDWIEPSAFDENGNPITNPKWEAAKYEVAIFFDPAGIVYNFVPLRIKSGGSARMLEISGDFGILDDSVAGVPFKRKIDKALAGA